MAADMRWMTLVVVLPLAGCEPALLCNDGLDERDGVCIGQAPGTPDAPVESLEDYLDDLGPCQTAPGEPGRLNLAAGCAGDVCVGGDYARLAATAGDELSCEGGDTWLSCEWRAEGLTVTLPAANGVPLADGTLETVFLDVGFDGSTTDGLGVGASTSCFIEALGMPDFATMLVNEEGDAGISEAFWRTGIHVRDGATPRWDDRSDGIVDRIGLMPPTPEQ